MNIKVIAITGSIVLMGFVFLGVSTISKNPDGLALTSNKVKEEELEDVEYRWNVGENVQAVLVTLINNGDFSYGENNEREISMDEYRIVSEIANRYVHNTNIKYFKFDIATASYVMDNGKEYFVLEVQEGSAYYCVYN